MTETQGTISEWAAETFGPPSSHARVAGRLIEECAELVRECTAGADRCRIADECADTAIVLCRLAARLAIPLPLEDRGDLSGQWLARNLSTHPIDLANEALKRCTAILDFAFTNDRVSSAEPILAEKHSVNRLADALECLCRQAGTDLQAAVDAKMAVNRKREWKLTGDGHGHHVRDKAGASP